jgi:hypothetical protein
MDKVEQILNLEVKPSIMPPVDHRHYDGWLDDAKVKLQAHFDQRTASLPVYDRAVTIRK